MSENQSLSSNIQFPPIPKEASSQGGARTNNEWRAYLVQPGDIPVNQKGGDNAMVAYPHPMTRNYPGLIFRVTQWIDLVERDGEIAGEATIFVYETVESAKQGYVKAANTQHEITTLNEIGEQSNIWQYQDMTQVVFQRCRAVMMVKGTWQIDASRPRGFFRKEDVIAYARRLDERIQQNVCKEP